MNKIVTTIKTESEEYLQSTEVFNSDICNFCGKKFSNISHLKMHIERVHSLNKVENVKTQTDCDTKEPVLEVKNSDKRPNYSCQYCFKTFTSTVVFRNHELVHKYTKECPFCPKKFFQDSHLKFHLRLHGVNEFDVKMMKKKSTDTPKVVIKQENDVPEDVEETLEKEESPKMLEIDDRKLSVVHFKNSQNNAKKRKIDLNDMIEDLSSENDVNVKPGEEIEQNVDMGTDVDGSESEHSKSEIESSYSSCCNKMYKDLTEYLLHVEENHVEKFKHTVKELLPLLEETIQDIKEEEQTSSKDMVLVVPWY